MSETFTVNTLSAHDRRLLHQLQEWIATPPETSRKVTVTPAVAYALLQLYNRKNRPIKPARIAEYARAMGTEDFVPTGDTLKFSDLELLRDGQNRLMACYQSGCPFTTHIVFGIPDHYFDRIDRGKNRDGSDLLAIAGYSNTAWLAGATRWVHVFASGRVKQREVFEPRVILRLLQENYPSLPDYIQQTRQVYETCKSPPGITLALLYLFAQKNPGAAADYAAAWAGGKWAGRFQPLGLMQQAVMKLHEASLGRVHEVIRAALMVKAWNLFIAGRRGIKSDFVWALAEPFPTIEG